MTNNWAGAYYMGSFEEYKARQAMRRMEAKVEATRTRMAAIQAQMNISIITNMTPKEA